MQLTAKKNYLNFIFPLILALVTLFICSKNYTPDTFLTGWDTLHPEFNLSLYWERILGGAWQEHQGLGTVASQAHAAEIPRVLILQFFDIFLGTSQIRYAYAFLMLVLGPLGVYFFIRELFKDKKDLIKNSAAFIGAIFYLLNLSTLHHFYVPLEMFLTHFAFLGWIFFITIRYLNGGKNNLLWFVAVMFFSAPQAHTSTLFISFLLAYLLFLALFVAFGSKDELRKRFKKTVVLSALILLVNAFWLGPNLYFIFTQAKEVSQSKIHRLFSEEAFLQSREFGNIENVTVLKGFLFNWGEHVGNGQYGKLLNEWNTYYLRTNAQFVGYLFFGFVICGVVTALFLEKNPFTKALLGVFLIALFFVINSNPPTGILFTFMQNTIPLFKEAFRFPFTKFSSLLAMSYAVFIAYFLTWAFSRLDKWQSTQKVVVLLIDLSLSLLLIYYMFPAFEGNLVSPSMRVSIPDRYFELFDYFDAQQDYGRVADLPIHSLWGWAYYNWEPLTKRGSQGAGFLWFGIKQPLLDREFDRWGAVNEQYYKEMSYAVYSQDAALLERILEKYEIKWIILDKSVFQPSVDEKLLYFEEIEDLLSKIGTISLDEDFGNGLLVYKVSNDYQQKQLVEGLPVSGPKFFYEGIDPIYYNHGDYITSEAISYPFVGVTNIDESLKDNLVRSTDDSLYLRPALGEVGSESVLLDVIFVKLGSQIQIQLRDVFSGEVKAQKEIILPQQIVVDINGIPEPVDFSQISNEVKITTVSMSPGENLELVFYRALKAPETFSAFLSVLEPCSSVGAQTAYTLESSKAGFDLTARNVRACVTAPLDSVFKAPAADTFLLQTSVTVEGRGTLGEMCLLDDRNGDCLGTYEDTPAGINVFTLLSAADMGHYYLRFFANSKDADEASVSYKDLGFSVLSKLDSVNFDNVGVSLSTFNLGKELVFEKSVKLLPADLEILSSFYTCSKGERDLENASVEYSENGIHYTASEDFLCDTFKLPSFDSKDGFILGIESRNLEGLPLRLCLTNNESSRCDLYVSLPRNKDLTTSYYLISPTGGGSYTINLTSLVYGANDTSSNEVAQISVTPVPYKFLKFLESSSREIDARSAVLFSEAYDPGWVALCGYKICDAQHVLISNWKNGWVFDSLEETQSVTNIMFIPQLLQYLGYFLLASALVYAVVAARRPNEP